MSQIVNMKKTAFGYYLLLGMLVCVSADPVSAQSTRKMKRRGDAAFQQQNYYGAARWYAAVLYDSPLVTVGPGLVYPFQPTRFTGPRKLKNTLKTELQFKLAESYRLYGHYHDALPQYEQYLASQDTRYPLARLWYAESLLANNQPEKAGTAFKAFLQQYKAADGMTQKAKQGLANSEFVIGQRKQKPQTAINRLTALASPDGSNFGLEKIPDGSFLFTSSRHELQGKKREKIYPVRLYTADLKTGTTAMYTAIPGKINMGASSMTADGLSLYVTGWKEDPSSPQPQYQLYVTTRTTVTDRWSEPVALASDINIKGYRSKQPYVTQDGRFLLYASDRPGGYGKYDIWMVALQDGKPYGEVRNLGNAVNTAADEASPFYDVAAKQLFLSSDGRVGMGGMDVYAVNGDLNRNEWKEAVNLGAPVNSVKDDLYYRKDPASDMAYLSSDRASACCMEVFSAVALPRIDTMPNPELVKRAAPARPDTLVAVKDVQKQLMDSISAVTIDRLHVNYRFASARIRRVDYPQLAEVVAQLTKDPALNLLVASFTDCIGSRIANEILSRKRSAAVKAYLVSKGIAASRINIDFFGEKHLIVPCKENSSYDAGAQMANRRSDLILTTDKTPRWIPTGKELDLAPINKGLAVLPVENKTNLAFQKQPGGGTKEIAAQKTSPSALNETRLSATAPADTKAAGNTDIVGGTRYRRSVTATADVKAAPEKNKAVDPASPKKQGIRKSSRDSIARPLAQIIKSENTSVAAIGKDNMQKMKISALLDFSPRVKKPSLIEEMTSRTPKRSFEVLTTSDSVKVELYDNGVFDDDSVSVIYNKELVIYKQLLQTNKPITFYVKLSADIRRNEMIFFAENLGLTPPNSALMIITDGERKRTEINVSSDLEHNSVIYFIKVKK
jgi:outer membrane protein OmpA-like peptidoglycan-associated protein